MKLEEMKMVLGMESVPGCFEDIYSEIRDSWRERAGLILSEDYIREILTDVNALLPYMKTVLSAATEVRKSEAMCLLVCILEKWVRAGGIVYDSAYTPPSGEGLALDFLHLFAAIPTMPDSVKFLRDRNVPEDVINSTMQEYDMCFEVCRINIGRIAFDRGRLGWIRHVIANNLIWVGRLRFELPVKRVEAIKTYKNEKGDIVVLADGMHLHKSGHIFGSVGCKDEAESFVASIVESEDKIEGYPIEDGEVSFEKVTLKKSEWEMCLSGEDSVLAVHIPRSGDFDRDCIEASYTRMREIMKKCFSDMPYKAFHCRSWMMSRDLRKVLKPESNIFAFQNKYIHYPTISSGEWTLGNVFPGEGGLENLENYSENTSLQRNIKAMYKNGEYIYDDCGFFF